MTTKYSIKDLEHLSGIKAHTLRIWEQRYNLINPQRTKTNIRYYTDNDLKRLLNVSVLVHDGLRISKVAAMSDSQLQRTILEKVEYQGEFQGQLNGLKLSMMNFDQPLFDRIINNSVDKIGYEETFQHLIGEFIKSIGILWQTGVANVANEHFASNLIRQKLCTAIDKLPEAKPDSKSFLLYLPNNELHELGLLYLSYIIRSKGHSIIYMGQTIDIIYLNDVLTKSKIDVVISIFTSSPQKENVIDYLESLKKIVGDEMEVYLTGYQLSEIDHPDYSNFNFSKDLKSLELSLPL